MKSIDIIKAKQALSLLGRTRQTIPFLYCEKSIDGVPVLLLRSERIPGDEVWSLSETALVKNFVRGFVTREKKEIVFNVERGEITQFVIDLGGVFDEMIPGLRFSLVK